MQIHTDLIELCDRLSLLDAGALVGVEGFTSSGKSFLSDAIKTEIANCSVIHTDNCVAPGDESLPYVMRLDFDRLKSLLVNSMNSSIVLVEGICLRHVLARTSFTPSLFIYVKRMSANGIWHDGFHLEDYEGDDQSVVGEPEISDFRYHSLERPHERADVVFLRQGN